jgi:5'-nucleotidase
MIGIIGRNGRLVFALVALAGIASTAAGQEPAAVAQGRRPRILLANDDGIAAPGLAAAYSELAKLGKVTVAAPATDQSGAGHGITYAEPIFVDTIDPLVEAEGAQGPWYRIAARPATCVRLALATLLAEPPDLVVSGINRGDNAGLTLYVSGTVGAAREAALDGIPAIAASLVDSPKMDYAPGAAVLGRIAAAVLKGGLPRGTFLSINIPAVDIRGVKVVRSSQRAGVNRYERRESPRGRVYFWNMWTPPADPDPETDAGALPLGWVTVTPLRIDTTDSDSIDSIRAWDLR